MYVSPKDYFVKTAKVFGEAVPAVKQALEKAGCREYAFSEDHQSLEFHVNYIALLKKMDIEIGVSTQVVETRENEPFLRELKVDVTTPQSFRLSKDL
jgi:hypothetical protein